MVNRRGDPVAFERQEAMRDLRNFVELANVYADRAAAIKRAHRAGATITEIAEVLGVSRQIVYDALRGGRVPK